VDIGLAIVGLLGWGGLTRIVAAGAAWRPMMPWTAMGHFLAGTSLVLLLGSKASARKRAGRDEDAWTIAVVTFVRRAAAVLVWALGVITLVQWASGWDAGVDPL